jgi:hypothetical protein
MASVSKEERQEIARQALAEFCNRQPRQFLTMRLKGRFSWPRKFTKLRLFDRDWLLWPDTAWDIPAIIVHCPTGNGAEEAQLAFRFLSALAWVHNISIQDEGFPVVGNSPNPCFSESLRPEPLYVSRHGLLIDENDYLPFPRDEKARIALALYREALNLEDNSYQFLSFFKILNVQFERGRDQTRWINNNLASVNELRAKKRISQLQQAHADVGQYLYESGRCAVAHAFSQPVVNPDNPEDKRRLASDLPVIQALAELMIEHEFGIKSRTMVWREHLYELAGFKDILGVELMDLIREGYHANTEGEDVISRAQEVLPSVSVRLRGEEERPFEQLIPQIIQYSEGQILLRCTSENNLVSVLLNLNFRDERLEFDPEAGFQVNDDGSARAAHKGSLLNIFLRKLFGNGILEVWSNDKLLGRKDAFIPTNIDMGRTLDNFDRAAKKLQHLCLMRTIGVSEPHISLPVNQLRGSSCLTSIRHFTW